MWIALTHRSSSRLAAAVDHLASQDFTYPEVGATKDPGSLPPGYLHDCRSIRLGNDRRAYDQGKDALIGWEAHLAIGARLIPEKPPLRPGQVVIVTIPVGPLKMFVPCRIVYVTNEERRFGFAYGTLPGHAERGEESFHIVEGPSGEVRFEIAAFSRPDGLLVRLGNPVVRRVQVRATGMYLEGVRRYVEEHR